MSQNLTKASLDIHAVASSTVMNVLVPKVLRPALPVDCFWDLSIHRCGIREARRDMSPLKFFLRFFIGIAIENHLTLAKYPPLPNFKYIASSATGPPCQLFSYKL